MWLEGDDYRVESMIAFWLENEGGNINSITIHPLNTFQRSYKSDVLDISILNNQHHIEISREGLYDMLPEGLFHEGKRKAQKTTEESVEESIRYRQEERAARKFFLPLEQEFYRQRIWLEHLELKASLNSINSQNVSMFLKFWGIQADLFSLEQNNFMLAVLPNIHRIAGNLILSAYCLEVLIQANVSIHAAEVKEHELSSDDHLVSVLGDTILGVDSSLGRFFLDDEPGIAINIGPVAVDRLYPFLPECLTDRQLKVLYGFFFPAETEIVTYIEVEEASKAFALEPMEESFSRLGFTTVL